MHDPIPTRGALGGWFFLFVPDLTSEQVNRGTVVLTVTDFSGKDYVASSQLGGDGTAVFQIGE